MACLLVSTFALSVAWAAVPGRQSGPVPFNHRGPIATADSSIRHAVTLRVPARLKIERTATTLSVSLDAASLRPVDTTVGKDMVIAEREESRVYEAGTPRPADYGDLGLGSFSEDHGSVSIDTGGTRIYNASQDHIPVAGRTYIVEINLTVFETNTLPEHMWRPEVGKVLWTGTVTATVKP